MAYNTSMAGHDSLQRQNDRVIIVQILVVILLCINMLLIFTFFSKEVFYTTMRYILFAVTLLSDSLMLFVTDVLLFLAYYRITMQFCFCVIFYIISVLCVFVTPISLTAMALERYVAICMPLRHAELCSTRSALHCILIIHGLSSVPCIVILSVFCASASQRLYTEYKICSMEIFVSLSWQNIIKTALYQCYFLIMSISIILSYVEIMKVAKAASGEDKKSTRKGLRTVILHAFQVFLCLIQLWCPFIESAVLQIDVMLHANIRYFNYITFILAPRCLSPLIYGLRDEKFFLALKQNIPLGFQCVKKKCRLVLFDKLSVMISCYNGQYM